MSAPVRLPSFPQRRQRFSMRPVGRPLLQHFPQRGGAAVDGGVQDQSRFLGTGGQAEPWLINSPQNQQLYGSLVILWYFGDSTLFMAVIYGL